MFTTPRPNVIVSDEGFSVEVLGRTGVKYEDNLSAVMVDGEVLAGPAGFMIYKDSARVVGGEGRLSDSRREVVVDNIRRAFAHRGFNIEIY